MAGITCPLTNTPQWKALEQVHGDTMARILFAKNDYDVPSLEKAKELLYEKQLQEQKDYEQSDEYKNQGYAPNEVRSTLKSVQVAQTPKAIENWGKLQKGRITLDQFLDNSQFPKEQKELIKGIYNEEHPKAIGDLMTSLATKYSYTVEINTAREKESMNKEIMASANGFSVGGSLYKQSVDDSDPFGFDKDVYLKDDKEITYDEYLKALYNYNHNEVTPTQHYSNMIASGYVAGKDGWDYKEKEIATPGIIPSIKGHSQFSTNNGLGWLRVLENREKGIYAVQENQSDLFQKGRGKSNLVNAGLDDEIKRLLNASPEESGDNRDRIRELIELRDNQANKPDNQFLQLLNKDGNWVSFFIKASVQDAAKQGFKEVWYPTGDTASKIEGHQTLEDFKKQKEGRIKELEKQFDDSKKKDYITIAPKSTPDFYLDSFPRYELNKRIGVEKGADKNDYIIYKGDLYNTEGEIKQLQEELKRVETDGFGALKPIYDFYENRVANTLKKIYGKDNVERIKDEHGNEWNRVTIDNKRDTSSIYFQKDTKSDKEAPNKQLNQQLSKFVDALRGEIRNVDSIIINGKVYDAVAVTDIINKTIQVVEGKAGKDTLPEEVGHLFVEYLPKGSLLLSQMMEDIVDRPLYNEVYEEYKNNDLYKNDDGTVNEDKIAREAIGKMVSKAIQEEWYNNKAQWENQKEKGVWQKMLDKLWKWIDNIVKHFQNKTENARTLEIHEDMHTMDLGSLEGTKETKQSQAYVEDMIRNHPNVPIKGGESFNGFKNRILDNFKEIIKTVPNHTLMISNSTVLKLIDSWLKEGSKDDNSIDLEHFLKEKTNPGELYEFITPDNRKIYGMRHGETVDNKEGLYRTVDTPLTDKGIEEIKEDAKYFKDKKIPLIIAPDNLRNRQTAAIIKGDDPYLVAAKDILSGNTKKLDMKKFKEAKDKGMHYLELSKVGKKIDEQSPKRNNSSTWESSGNTAFTNNSNETFNKNHSANETTTAAKPTQDPVVKEKTNKQIDKLQEINKQIEYHEKEEKGILNTSFSIDGNKIKNKVDTSQVGLKNKVIEKRGEEDLKAIFDKYINKDGVLREFPLDKEYDSKLNPNDERIINTLDRAIYTRLKEYPEGTKFIHDINIYSRALNKAAKLNFIAFKPDGKADVLNFVFVQKALSFDSEQKDLYVTVQDKMRNYMNEQKGILKTEYGIDKFDKSRTIPITISWEGVGNRALIREILIDGERVGLKDRNVRPIPTLDEKTGIKPMDTLLSKLNSIYNARNKESFTEEKPKILERLQYAIKNIQLGNGTKSMIRLINSTTFSFQEGMKDFKKINLTSNDKLTDEQVELAAKKLNLSVPELVFYKDVDNYFNEYFNTKENITEEELNQLEKLKQEADRSKKVLHDYMNVRNIFVSSKMSDRLGIKDLLYPEARVSILPAQFNNFSEASTKASQLAYRMINIARNKWEMRGLEMQNKLNKILDEGLTAWIKSNGNSKLLDLLKAKDSRGERINKLPSEFKKDFYNILREKIDIIKNHTVENETTKAERLEIVKWIKENVDTEAVEKEIKEKRLKQIEILNKAYGLNVKHDDDFPDIEPDESYYHKLTYINKRYNVTNYKMWTDFKIVSRYPKKYWYSDEYNDLLKNAPVKQFYDFIREVNEIAAKSGYIKQEQKKKFLPFLTKTFIESKVLGGDFSFGNAIMKTFTISNEDLNRVDINRLTNEPINVLPRMFTYDSSEEKVDSKTGETYRSYAKISDDLIKNVAIYTAKVLEFDESQKIEAQLKLLQEVEKSKYYLQTNQFGYIAKNSETGDMMEPALGNVDNAKILEDYIAMHFYKQSYINSKNIDSVSGVINDKMNEWIKGINKVTGMKLPELEGENRLSMTKFLDSMKNYQQLKVLGFNLGTSIVRYLGTNLAGFINAGDYYSLKDFFNNELKHGGLQMFKKDAVLHAEIIKAFMPVGSYFKEEVSKLSLSKITRESISDILMKPIEKSHDYIQYVNFGAMLDNAVIVDGKIENARRYIKAETAKERYAGSSQKNKLTDAQIEEKVKKLIEEKGLIKNASIKDGNLVIDGLNLNSESVAKFKSLIRYEGRRLSGNISPEDESIIRGTALGRHLLLFKNFLPGSIKTHFRDLSYIEGIQDYEWGRLRTLGAIIAQNGIRCINAMVDMSKANDKGIALMKDMYEKKKQLLMEKSGQNLDISEEQFYDLMRKNIQRNAREAMCMLTLLKMAAIIGVAASAANPEDKGYWSWMHRMSDRAYEEINLYYNPMSFNNIINGSLFPAFSLPVDAVRFLNSAKEDAFGHITNDDKRIKKAKLAKHTMKLFPITKEFPNYISAFNYDLAKELGIPTNQQTINK